MVIEMLPAGRGDCLLVRCPGSDGTRTNILIDGGVESTFHKVLETRLRDLAATGQSLALAVVTHIDSDHVGGILEFVAANKGHADAAVIRVDEVWHNSYRHLELGGRRATVEEEALVASRLTKTAEAREGIVSGAQGSGLAALLRRGGYPWNAAFGGGAVTGAGSDSLTLGDGVVLTVLGPSQHQLQALAKVWRQELAKLGVPYDATTGDSFEVSFEVALLARYDRRVGVAKHVSGSAELTGPNEAAYEEDRSKTNASSIVFLLEHAGVRCLFLGDAPASSVAAAIRARCRDLPLEVDVLKLSHHGSRNNTSLELLRLIKAKTVLVSTDGSAHGHPDLEPLVWVLESQPRGVRLVFSHPSPASERLLKADALARFGHHVEIGTGANGITIEGPNR